MKMKSLFSHSGKICIFRLIEVDLEIISFLYEFIIVITFININYITVILKMVEMFRFLNLLMGCLCVVRVWNSLFFTRLQNTKCILVF